MTSKEFLGKAEGVRNEFNQDLSQLREKYQKDLAELRAKYLGKGSPVEALLKELRDLDASERVPLGHFMTQMVFEMNDTNREGNDR